MFPTIFTKMNIDLAKFELPKKMVALILRFTTLAFSQNA
jgi:hypothetical protein